MTYQFEPLYQEEAQPTIDKKYIYHITTLNAWNKIKEIGFCPRSNCTIGLRYPNRVYFFTQFDKEYMENYIRASKKKNKVYVNGKVVDSREFVIIKVDVSKIDLNKVQFFKDNNVSDDKAVFTYNNLPSSIIFGASKIIVE